MSSAARSSALKESTPKDETGKRVDFPLPGGPAITIRRGTIRRGTGLSAEVAIGPFEHVFGYTRFQAPALVIGDTKRVKFLGGGDGANAGGGEIGIVTWEAEARLVLR